MNQVNAEILISDSNAYTRSLLLEQFARIANCSLHARASLDTLEHPQQMRGSDILLLNFHVEDPAPFAVLQRIKQHSPNILIVMIVAPGVARKEAEACQRSSACIEKIFDKPIDLAAVSQFLTERLIQIKQQRDLQQTHLNLLRFLPTGALNRVFANPVAGHAELFDMAVMFTDIRDSTKLITQQNPRDYFAQLNVILSSQARHIRQYDGMVVKTTGDGLLAVFEGAARCHLALKCATTIQQNSPIAQVSVGIGISDGLVLTGILGSSEHLHFDVIGAHVHLAARLCHQAQAGEILATNDVAQKARFEFASTRIVEAIQVRGFDAPVPCIHIQP